MLLDICLIFNIIGTAKTIIINALTNDDFSDFEDCIQMECAEIAGAEYIVTRNINDFKASVIKPVLPEEFLKFMQAII